MKEYLNKGRKKTNKCHSNMPYSHSLITFLNEKEMRRIYLCHSFSSEKIFKIERDKFLKSETISFEKHVL